MKHLFIILFGFFVTIEVLAQQLSYNGELVDTLKITSEISGESHNVIVGVREAYIIVFNKELNNYILNPYQRTEYDYNLESKTKQEKLNILKQGKVVDNSLISNLLVQFENKTIYPTFEKLELSKKDFAKMTSKRKVLSIAKWYKVDKYLKWPHTEKSELKEIFEECQNIDTFNVFLSSTFYKDNTYRMVTGGDRYFNVFISTAEKEYNYRGEHPQTFRQPWYDSSDIFNSSLKILNFSINSALISLLPNKFIGINDLKYEALIDEYIVWYLKRAKIIHQ